MTAALEGGEWSVARPGRTLPPGKIRYPFYRRLGGTQGRSGRAENLVPTGIRSRTIQPVAQSLYRLSYPAHNCIIILCHNIMGPPSYMRSVVGRNVVLRHTPLFLEELVDHKLITMHYTNRTIKSFDAIYLLRVMIIHEDGLRQKSKYC